MTPCGGDGSYFLQQGAALDNDHTELSTMSVIFLVKSVIDLCLLFKEIYSELNME